MYRITAHASFQGDRDEEEDGSRQAACEQPPGSPPRPVLHLVSGYLRVLREGEAPVPSGSQQRARVDRVHGFARGGAHQGLQDLDARRVALGLQPAPALQDPQVRPRDRGRAAGDQAHALVDRHLAGDQRADPQDPHAVQPQGHQGLLLPGWWTDDRHGPPDEQQAQRGAGLPDLHGEGRQEERVQGSELLAGVPREQGEPLAQGQPRPAAVRLDPRAHQERGDGGGHLQAEGRLIKVAKQ